MLYTRIYLWPTVELTDVAESKQQWTGQKNMDVKGSGQDI